MTKFLFFFCVITIVIYFSEGQILERIPSKVWIKYGEQVRCSGVIISPRYVLTLQACIADQKNIKNTVRYGKTNGKKYYYTLFVPDDGYLQVEYNLKMYKIKIMKGHKIVRPHGHSWGIYLDHIVVIELTQKVELADAENDESNFTITNVLGPPVKSHEYLQFVAFFAHDNNMPVTKYIHTTPEGVCQNYTDVVSYDVVCGLYLGYENSSCKVFPGDPIFDDSMKVVGLMKNSYKSMSTSMPIPFLSLYQHAAWIQKVIVK